jgi:hypothetical protein
VPEARIALRKIARDEAAHARLARAILAFCIERDERVLPAILRLPLETRTARAPAPSEDLAAHGLVTDDERRAIAREVARRARRTLVRARERLYVADA